MTGFASVRHATSSGELTVSLRCVNHRGFDLHTYLGGEFAEFENGIRTLLKDTIRRGHIEVRFSLARERGTQPPGYDGEKLREYVAQFRRAAAELKLPSEPVLNVLFSFPGVWSDRVAEESLNERFGGELLNGLRRCADELNLFREREGEALRAEIEGLAREIQALNREIAEIRATAVPAFYERLREKLSELLQSSGISEARLAEEAVLLADRSDIQEELTRLETHSAELQRLLEMGGEVGKRIDFLLQEMNREANTLLAKSAGAGEPGLRLTNLGLRVKANIERIREQALNLE